MLDESVADRWLSIAAREESILGGLVEVLQSDQRAVAAARVEEIEGNVVRKETAITEMRMIEESKRNLIASIPGGAENFAGLPRRFPVSRRSPAEASLARLRSLREAAAELNELSRRIMIHGLFLVRSTLGAVAGDAGASGYAENGDRRPPTATGKIVRQNA